MTGMDEVADDLLKLYNGLKTERDGFGGTWRFARWFLIPHKVDDFSARPSDFVGRVRNGTAKLACERLAGSNLSYVMPSHEQWFRWGCRPGDVEDEDRDEADAWYAACTDIALAELTRSNFYTEVYECCSDRAGLGTGALYGGPGKDRRLLFKSIQPEHCCGVRDEDGRVVVFIREMLLSAYDVADLFGTGSLKGKVKGAYEEGGAKMYEKKWVVLHVVRRAKKPEMGRGWESVYVDVTEKGVLKRVMEWEMPFMATRFLKNGESFFGFPAWLSVDGEIEELEQIEKDLAKARRVAVDPRILEIASQVGEVDLRAGGRTVIDPTVLDATGGNMFPREWAGVGDVGLSYKQLGDKERRVKDAFFSSLLDLFDSYDGKNGYPTATEVMARQNQYLMQFFPSFVLFADDIQPMLDRIFMVLYRAGAFPPVPDCVLKPVMNGDVKVGVALNNPGVTFHNRVALVLQRVGSDAMMSALREFAELQEVLPGAMDHFDKDFVVRSRARALGVPERGLLSETDVEDARRAEMAALEEQQSMMEEQQGAATEKDLAAARKLQAEAERAGGK